MKKLVYIDSKKCIGCGKCVSLCHRNAPSFQLKQIKATNKFDSYYEK
ncbi:4Fe-4S binding protein [Clostridium oryzae]|nr:4Fe-4S binding protein [Clostridium oryzae]